MYKYFIVSMANYVLVFRVHTVKEFNSFGACEFGVSKMCLHLNGPLFAVSFNDIGWFYRSCGCYHFLRNAQSLNKASKYRSTYFFNSKSSKRTIKFYLIKVFRSKIIRDYIFKPHSTAHRFSSTAGEDCHNLKRFLP